MPSAFTANYQFTEIKRKTHTKWQAKDAHRTTQAMGNLIDEQMKTGNFINMEEDSVNLKLKGFLFLNGHIEYVLQLSGN